MFRSKAAGNDGDRSGSAPQIRLGKMSIGGRSSPSADSAQQTPPADGKRPPALNRPKLGLPGSRPARQSDTAAIAASATAKDLAPTTKKAETTGEMTQGDFLMAAKARRRQQAEAGGDGSPVNTSSGTSASALDDSQVHAPIAPSGGTPPPPQRRRPGGSEPSGAGAGAPPKGGSLLGDIDIPTKLPGQESPTKLGRERTSC